MQMTTKHSKDFMKHYHSLDQYSLLEIKNGSELIEFREIGITARRNNS